MECDHKKSLNIKFDVVEVDNEVLCLANATCKKCLKDLTLMEIAKRYPNHTLRELGAYFMKNKES